MQSGEDLQIAVKILLGQQRRKMSQASIFFFITPVRVE